MRHVIQTLQSKKREIKTVYDNAEPEEQEKIQPFLVQYRVALKIIDLFINGKLVIDKKENPSDIRFNDLPFLKKKQRLTEKQFQAIINWKKEGIYSNQQIADKLGLSAYTLCKRLKVYKKKNDLNQN